MEKSDRTGKQLVDEGTPPFVIFAAMKRGIPGQDVYGKKVFDNDSVLAGRHKKFIKKGE